MNIYEKLQNMRVALQGQNIKKSGYNKHLNYHYYELGDFMPPINQLMKDNGVCSIVTYGPEMATLTLINAEKVDECITFTSPMAEAKLGSAHPIQNLGAVETYQRRYLYMTAFEIVEADVLDASQGEDNAQSRGYAQRGNNSTGYQKPAKSAPAKPQQQTQQANKLPDDVSNQLNAAIKNAKNVSGMTVAQVVEEVERRTEIKMQDVNVNNAGLVLAAIELIAMEAERVEDELPY